ncbi:MAG: hypothetical protein JWM93_2028 [Frankiales bacterium]|nr:hypothetical protein [Frankiales bacterium]
MTLGAAARGGGGLVGESVGGTGAEGGTQTAGGHDAAGGYGPKPPGVPMSGYGVFGVGGRAGTGAGGPSATPGYYATGGGGGGWYGGGGGAYVPDGTAGDARGGGGSGYVGGAVNAVMLTGVRAGHGQVVLTPVTPNSPTLVTPSTGETLNAGTAQRFSWSPSFPITGDTQSGFDLRYRPIGAPSWAVIHGDTPNALADVTAGTFAASGDYEWQVRTYESLGAVGPYSASGFFSTAPPPPGPVITAPVNNSTVGLSTGAVTWSTAGQMSFQVRKVADSGGTAVESTVYVDSGELVSTSDRSYALTFPVNNRPEHIQVRVKSGGLWSPWSSVRVDVAYTAPAAPTVTVTPDNGSDGQFTPVRPPTISVAQSHPTPIGTQPAVTAVDVLRSTAGGPLELIAAAVPPSATFIDYTPASGVDYTYVVRAYGANGTWRDSAESTDTATPSGGSYGSYRLPY